MPDFEVGKLPTCLVCCKRGQPAPIDIVEAQMGTRLVTFTTDNVSYPL